MAEYAQGTPLSANPLLTPSGAVRDDGTYITLKSDLLGNLRVNQDLVVAGLTQIAQELQTQKGVTQTLSQQLQQIEDTFLQPYTPFGANAIGYDFGYAPVKGSASPFDGNAISNMWG